MSTRDIALQLEELYGAQVSPVIISEVTDVVSEDVKVVTAGLKPIYRAATLGAAAAALEDFAAKWDEPYPAGSRIWFRRWENLIPSFDDPMDIRRVVYTTNAIESVNRSLRKGIKTKAGFLAEAAVFKLMYLAMNNIVKCWHQSINNGKAVLSQVAMVFPECGKL